MAPLGLTLALQACIDMNKVMEVARADEVTGNPFSVAITAPDRVHFVKGTCKEESAWWLEVLQIFPRSRPTGRAKRNATFPGGISTTYMAETMAPLQTPPVKCSDKEVAVVVSVGVTAAPAPSPAPATRAREVRDGRESGRDALVREAREAKEARKAREKEGREGREVEEGTHRYKKIKGSKTGLTGERAYRSLRSNTCENLSAIPAEYARPKSRYSKLEAEPDFPTGEPAAGQPVIQIDSPATEEEDAVAPAAPSPPTPSPPPQLLPARGVPDGGCGVEAALPPATPPPSKPEPLPPIPVPSPHDLLNCKKGWLMKQSGAEWQKHWFVLQVGAGSPPSTTDQMLQGSALMYFKDPGAENAGLLDGIIDLGLVQKVSGVSYCSSCTRPGGEVPVTYRAASACYIMEKCL